MCWAKAQNHPCAKIGSWGPTIECEC